MSELTRIPAPDGRFYAQAGFGPDGGEEPFDVHGVAVPEVRYARTLPRPGAGTWARP